MIIPSDGYLDGGESYTDEEMEIMKQMNWKEFSEKYCERQEQNPSGLAGVLSSQINRFKPIGFMLLECEQLDSSYIGQLTILPYGGESTYKTIPNYPISSRGLSSDMFVVIGYILSSEVPTIFKK